jgi:hypothetical protein
MSVPVDDQGQFIDSGHRRDVGVTHWHLIEPREWAVNVRRAYRLGRDPM